jgi:CheY-like chemotaxis protein
LQEAGLFAYEFAHKSKGDLAVLSNSIQRLRESHPTGETDDFLNVMDEVVASLKKDAQDILAIARESTTTFEVIPLIALHEQLDKRWGWTLKQREIDFRSQLAIRDVSLVADRAMLMEILENLVRNSIEAIARRQQSESAYRGSVALFAHVTNESVDIYVCDNALGIPDQIRGKMFRQRIRTELSRGAGLGLTIVKRYVDANRGRIELCNALPPSISQDAASIDWRTVFHITLPRGTGVYLYSVLVVDDQRTFYSYIKAEFARKPAFGEVDHAQDIEGAIALTRSKKYDMVLLDMFFDKQLAQGPEALMRLRQCGYEGLIVVVSSYLDKIEEAKRLKGVAAVISKEDAGTIPDRCESLLRLQAQRTGGHEDESAAGRR